MAELDTTFIGTATIRIADSRFPGPFLQQLTLSPVFSGDRKAVDIGPFPSIVFPTLGQNTTTITKKAGGNGQFDLNSGAMLVPVTLRFDHSFPDIFVPDSDLPLLLTTAAATSPHGAFTLTGTPLNPATRIVTLAGASAFVGGFLNDKDCSISITGTVSPSPFVTDQFQPPIFAEGCPGNGIAGYDLAEPADRIFAFDYDSSGRLDHLVLYRPGFGTLWIVKHLGGNDFAPVFAGNGIAGYDLAEPADRISPLIMTAAASSITWYCTGPVLALYGL